MSMEIDFRDVLAGDPEILAAVTTGPVTRIYPANYTQGSASPAIRFNRVAGAVGLHMRGSDGLDEATVQVDVRVADSGHAVQDCITLRDKIVARLHGFSGLEGNTEFQLIELVSDRGINFDDTGPTKYYTASMDFVVWSRVSP